MRPVFCGNFEYDTRQSELERLFSKYGRVERIDMKSGIPILFNLCGPSFYLSILPLGLLLLKALPFIILMCLIGITRDFSMNNGYPLNT